MLVGALVLDRAVLTHDLELTQRVGARDLYAGVDRARLQQVLRQDLQLVFDLQRDGGWGLRVLAWAFATLFVAGFKGAVRKT
ncbi:hypothetical protein [Fodinicola acaciae]|uniref:hypothetical protein n=1 Tax=Fodinicola acaciae TaxID=2681555 RepID=UPI0013D2A136|nr:hypothetical protein [Fodinicola acaciae]